MIQILGQPIQKSSKEGRELTWRCTDSYSSISINEMGKDTSYGVSYCPTSDFMSCDRRSITKNNESNDTIMKLSRTPLLLTKVTNPVEEAAKLQRAATQV
jgi:hypothetical protein